MTIEIMAGCEGLSHRGGASGVLVLHGFTGNPSSMRPLAERAMARGYGVELPRLPGHGTSVADLKGATWDDWAATALAAFDELAARSERVAVVGLSMGGGLAAYVAELRDVAGCVFINPMVKPLPDELRDGAAQLLAAGVDEFESIGSDIKKTGTRELSYDATPLAPVVSLNLGLETVARDLGRVDAPCLLFSSREDHVLTVDNGDDLVAGVAGPIERVWLENSYHVATLDNDQELLESLTMDFLARVLG